MIRFEQALRVAVMAHAGQMDKAGLPYILHPIRVSESLEDGSDKIVAVLHDVLEDTDVGMDQACESLLFNGESIFRLTRHESKALRAITKLEKIGGRYESYREYLDRVRSSEIALRVKLADMADNSRTERLAYLSVEKQVRLAAKYARGRHYLLTGEWYENEDLDRVIKAGYKR